MYRKSLGLIVAACSLALLAGCETTNMKMGSSKAKTVATGAAAGMQALQRERAPMGSGEMRYGSNVGKGQVVASDYGMSTEIIFSNSGAAGIGAFLGALVGGGAGQVLAAVGGGLKTREASAMLTLVDNRSTVQVAVSEGGASKSYFAGFGAVFGGVGGAGVGG